jgi:hypothetical protein
MASDIGRFNDIRGHSLVDWRAGCGSSPLELELLICHRPGTNTSQLFRLQREGGELLPVTHCSDDAVASGSYEPIHGDIVVFERSRGGSEEVHWPILQPVHKRSRASFATLWRDADHAITDATLPNEFSNWKHPSDHPRHSQTLPPYLASLHSHCAVYVSAARPHRRIRFLRHPSLYPSSSFLNLALRIPLRCHLRPFSSQLR